MKVQWNTGRGYTAQGQRIVAIHEPEHERVSFVDHDRHIAGEIACFNAEVMSPIRLREFVMYYYDHCQYRDSCMSAMEDLGWE